MKTVAIDFDGVIHPYTHGWVGVIPADEPPHPDTWAVFDALRLQGFRIVVFSARATSREGLEAIIDYLREHRLEVDDVTHVKPAAVAYVDDRAVPFLGDWEPAMAAIAALDEKRDASPYHT